VKYKIGDLQIFVTPDAEKMMEFHGLPETFFEYPGTIRTLLFIDCGLMTGDVRSGGRDYHQVIGRMYESADPQGEDENHKGKLYVNVHETDGVMRFEPKVERFEWYPDGSFDVISPSGERKRTAVGPNFSMTDRSPLRDTLAQKFNQALGLDQAGRRPEANILFREILPAAEDISVRFVCAWSISKELLLRIRANGEFPSRGTTLYQETSHYVKVALESFDRAADYLKEDAAEDMVGFREVLKVLVGS
jgi:hypothetical protein